MSRAFENIPAEQFNRVLALYNYLAKEAGERVCEDFDDVLVDISCRRKRADQYIFGASRRLQALLDKTYVELVGPYGWARRETKLRPWHALKTQDRLLRADSGSDKLVEYYLSEDEFKLIALVIAVGDRTKHGIATAPPALMNDDSFRNSFLGGGGAMLAPTNNADLVSGANTSRERFRITTE